MTGDVHVGPPGAYGARDLLQYSGRNLIASLKKMGVRSPFGTELDCGDVLPRVPETSDFLRKLSHECTCLFAGSSIVRFADELRVRD
jgi:hypothetical protein